MPVLKIFTNLSQSKIPKDLVHKIIPILAEGLKKEPSKFVCMVQGDCQLILNDVSTEPGVAATLESIGNLGPQENKHIVEVLSNFLQKEIGISPSRFIITFYDLSGHCVGKDGTTKADCS